MDSTMMYLHVKKTGNESVDPVKNLNLGIDNGCNMKCLFQKPTLRYHPALPKGGN